MKHLVTMIILFLIPSSLVLADVSAAKDNRPIQINALVSTTGLGMSAGYYLNKEFFFGIEGTGFLFNAPDQISKKEVNHKLLTSQLIIRYFPGLSLFSILPDPGIYLQGGFAYRYWEMKTSINDMADSIDTTVRYSPIAGNIGLGINIILTNGVSFGLGFSVYLAEKPEIDIKTGSTVTSDEKKQEENRIKKHHHMGNIVPQIYATIGYSF